MLGLHGKQAAYHGLLYIQTVYDKCTLPHVFDFETSALWLTKMLPGVESVALSTQLFKL